MKFFTFNSLGWMGKWSNTTVWAWLDFRPPCPPCPSCPYPEEEEGGMNRQFEKEAILNWLYLQRSSFEIKPFCLKDLFLHLTLNWLLTISPLHCCSRITNTRLGNEHWPPTDQQWFPHPPTQWLNISKAPTVSTLHCTQGQSETLVDSSISKFRLDRRRDTALIDDQPSIHKYIISNV